MNKSYLVKKIKDSDTNLVCTAHQVERCEIDLMRNVMSLFFKSYPDDKSCIKSKKSKINTVVMVDLDKCTNFNTSFQEILTHIIQNSDAVLSKNILEDSDIINPNK